MGRVANHGLFVVHVKIVVGVNQLIWTWLDLGIQLGGAGQLESSKETRESRESRESQELFYSRGVPVRSLSHFGSQNCELIRLTRPLPRRPSRRNEAKSRLERSHSNHFEPATAYVL